MKTDIAYAVYNPSTGLFHSNISKEDWTSSLRKYYLYKSADWARCVADSLGAQVVKVIMHSDMEML